MHKPYSAYFVGTPSSQEEALLQSTRLLVDFQVVANSDDGNRQILQALPDYVMLPLTCSDKLVLELFHQLREDGRTCVVVWGEQTLTAFSGKGYRWRKSAPKNLFGLERLMEWGKWPLPVNHRITGQILHVVAAEGRTPELLPGRRASSAPEARTIPA